MRPLPQQPAGAPARTRARATRRAGSLCGSSPSALCRVTRPWASKSQILLRASVRGSRVARLTAAAKRSAHAAPVSPAPANRNVWAPRPPGLSSGRAARTPASIEAAPPCRSSLKQRLSPRYRFSSRSPF